MCLPKIKKTNSGDKSWVEAEKLSGLDQSQHRCSTVFKLQFFNTDCGGTVCTSACRSAAVVEMPTRLAAVFIRNECARG